MGVLNQAMDQLSSLKILIIDDSPEDRSVLIRYINKGFGKHHSDLRPDIYECSLVKDAQEQLRLNDFDCIIIDYYLPDMNGLAAIKEIRQEFGSLIGIICLTGSGNEAVAASAFRSGANDYISKGDINPDAVYGALSKTLNDLVEVRRKQERQKDLELKNVQLSEAKMLLEERQRELIRMQLQTSIDMMDIERENTRRGLELEAAKRLQLSMLPVEPPKHKHVDMSMYLQTYSEVGGDYYDYLTNEDGEITLIVGDATGHGVLAGTVVAVAKSFFHTFGPYLALPDLLRQMSEGIRGLKVRNLYMGITLIRIKGDQVKIVSSGMPPIIHFDRNDQSIEQLEFKGPFLGSSLEWDYQELQLTVKKGDGFVILSDGLIELFNNDGEPLGIEPIESCIHESMHESCKGLIENLIALKLNWSEEKEINDDITIVSLCFNEDPL